LRWRVITFVAVVFTGLTVVALHMLLPRLLSAQLPALLTRVMDKPVEIGEISVSLLSLRADASRMVVGARDAPALFAENVEVALDGQAFFQGEIRLREIVASFTSVDLNSWRGDGSGKPVDRRIVNRWLPAHAHIETLAIRSGERLVSVTDDVDWQRLAAARQQLAWTQVGLSSPLAVRLEFSPVFALLQDQHGEIRLEVVRVDEPEAILTAEIAVAPAASGGATKMIRLDSQAIAGTWSFTSDELFAWPQTSVMRVQTLDVDRIQEVITQLVTDPAAEPRDWLQSPLPQLALPSHQVDLEIDELSIDDEAISGIAARLVLRPGDEETPPGIEVNDLFARLTDADLSGDITFTVGAQWAMAIDLSAASQDRDGGLEAFFEGSDWRWQRGRADFTSQGTKPIELFENARGMFEADGVFLAAQALPLHIRANFKSERGLLGSDALELQIGGSRVTGALWTDDSKRALNARLSSPYFNIDELRAHEVLEDDGPFDVVIPDLRWFPSDLPIDVEFAGDVLDFAGRRFTDVEIGLQHSAERASLEVSFSPSPQGRISLEATAQRFDVERALQLRLDMAGVGLEMFGVDVPVSIASAHLALAGRGISLPEIVPDLSGKLELRLATNSLTGDILLNAKPSIATEADKVSTVSLAEIDLHLGDNAHAQGGVQIGVSELGVAGHISSDSLNLDTLIKPASGSGPRFEIAPQLQGLVPVDLELQLGRFTLQGQTLSDVALSLHASHGRLDFSDASFASDYGAVDWQGSLVANNGVGDLKLDGDLRGLEVASLTESQIKDLLDKPLAGSVALQARGANWADLFGDARLQLQLKESVDSPNRHSEFDVDVELRRFADGKLQADIADLHWRDSDVRGVVTFRGVQPPELRADLTARYLDLTSLSETQAAADAEQTSGGLIRSVTDTASRTLGFLSGTLRSSLRASEQASDSSSAKYFDQAPLPVALLDEFDVDIRIAAERVKARRGEARGVTFAGRLGDRTLAVHTKSSNANGGPFDFVLAYDAAQQPARAKVAATLENVRPNPLPGVAPISVHVDLTGHGNSESAVASSLTGPIFIAVGRGTTRLAEVGSGILSGDLVQSIMGQLVPGSGKAPRLSCAIGYGELVDGKFASPAAIVLQTPKANILVQARADLGQETISAQFDSRSRTGTGLSVGNIFSNTVRLEGSLGAPRVVTNRASLLWRYGAAVATGGLSLVGESLYKRLMVDRAACATMKTSLQSKVCVSGSPLVESTLVCG